MNTPTREPGFIYIETPEEKRAHAPKRATDEVWDELNEFWRTVLSLGRFAPDLIYRRALPAQEPAGKGNEPYPSPMQETLERLAVIAMSARDLLQAGGDKERNVAAALQIVILESANFHTVGPAGKLPVPAENAPENSKPVILPAPFPVWNEGFPPHPYDKEWFIAKTKHSGRAVLTRLPDDYSYHFKTADETYLMQDNVIAWMQFPDSYFIPFVPAPAPQPAQEPDADAEGWIDASKRMPEINQLVWHTSKYAEVYAEPALHRFLGGFYRHTSKWRPAHVTIPPAPRAETPDEIDRKIAEALWLKIPGDVGARKTDYIAGVFDGLKAERERAKP